MTLLVSEDSGVELLLELNTDLLVAKSISNGHWAGRFSGRLFLKDPMGPLPGPGSSRPGCMLLSRTALPLSSPLELPGQEKIPWHGHCSWRLPCNNLPNSKHLAILIKDSTHGKACGLSKPLGHMFLDLPRAVRKAQVRALDVLAKAQVHWTCSKLPNSCPTLL